jgi:hypothetical protein
MRTNEYNLINSKKNRLYMILAFYLIFAGLLIAQDTINVVELEYPDDLQMIKRIDWGWLPLADSKQEHSVEYITIHHGGVLFTEEMDPVDHLKDLQTWSRKDKGWIDIPYHFLIDLDGNIYEARPINYPGDTNTEYDPTSHALVEVMGNYEIQELNKDQLESLVEIISFLAYRFKIPVSKIKSHKDYSKITDCPGKNIYKYLQDGTIVKSVKEKLQQKSESFN